MTPLHGRLDSRHECDVQLHARDPRTARDWGLEEETGVRLFHRTTRTVRLSEEGAHSSSALGRAQELREAQRLQRSCGTGPGAPAREAPSILGRHVSSPVSRDSPRGIGGPGRAHAPRPSGRLVGGGNRPGAAPRALRTPTLLARRLGRTGWRVRRAGLSQGKGTPRTVDALSRHECLGFSLHGRVMPWRLRDGTKVRQLSPGRRIVVNSGEALIDLALGGVGSPGCATS